MPFQHLKNKKLILASKSPRRQELLKGLGLSFEIRTKEIDESFPVHLKREEVAEYLAKIKGNAFADALTENEVLITADTIVCIDDDILNKPKNKAEAVSMLQRLSGRGHTVITGVGLKSREKTHIFHAATHVYFKALSTEQIQYYIEHYRPFDKAGSYGIQEWIGYTGIERIKGDYFNVVGLPLQKLWSALLEF